MYQNIGKFEIKKLLGHGAMGEVYLGVDPSIGREVAVKTIHPNAAQGSDAKQRFAREAKAAGILSHPNLVTIYEFGEDQDVLYIAMEFIPGQDLEEFLREQSLSRSEILEVLAQVCDGLSYAHGQGIVHRDIKPSNVRVIRDGKRLVAKVTDFGVARISNSEMTATGMVMGTVSYMAPEYIRSGKPDSRSDLFAVGVMLYEALSGRKPFSGDTTPTILYKIVNESPDPIDLSLLQGISPSVRSVLDRALVKDPDQRYQTAEEFARALRAAKDPTWAGQLPDGAVSRAAGTVALDATVQAAPPTQMMAPPSPALPPPLPTGAPEQTPPRAMPLPPQVSPTPKPSGSPLPLILGLAAGFLVLLGAGGLGYYYFSRNRVPEATTTPLAATAPTTPEAPLNPTPEVPPVQLPPTGTQPPPPSSPSTRSSTPVPAPQAPERTQPAPDRREKRSVDERFDPETLRSMSFPERRNLSMTTLSEAIAQADASPDQALEGLRNAISANPMNANAYAWLVAVLYEQGRYREIPPVFAKARQNGISRPQMMSNLRFRMAMQNERLNRRIPGEPGGGEE